MTKRERVAFKCAHCGRAYKRRAGDRGTNTCDSCWEPNEDGVCSICGASPTHKITGMCGPCTFGEAKTAGGNW